MMDYHVQSVRNHQAVRTTGMASFRDFLLYVILGAAFIAVFFCYSWQHLSMLSLHYQIEQIKQENEAVREQNRALALEQASLESPQRIDTVARQLGMVPAQGAGIVLLSEPVSAAPNAAASLQTPAGDSARRELEARSR